MPIDAYVTVYSVNEAANPPLVATSEGTFQFKRGMNDIHRRALMEQLQHYEGKNEQCKFTYVPQTKRSGGRHTLLDVRSR